ncbi:cd7 antigen-like [Salarias fasciatus]|uniref:cd7 antigen-like n=1 Tax=Salarias fasciatus TaxID=181472 RepID=UPI001176BC52|nr:uncharacterized protein LOC115390740 [Salarias fasciatus]
MSECYLAWLCALLITHSGSVFGDITFIERHEGESVVLPCSLESQRVPPVGVYLKRSWLRDSEVVFMYTGEEFHSDDPTIKARTSVSGDPSLHSLNITISQLGVGDTDRYYCEFIVSNQSFDDEHVRAPMEYFLHVSADVSGSVDLELVETCAGGSAVLPCVAPHGEGRAVEGVSLKRRRGRSPVEVLYHSRRPPSSTGFSDARVRLSSAPGPAGLAYNLTLTQLRPEDSALYSCQLLLPGRPDAGAALGRRVFFVSVQGGQCGCSSYSSLLYALSAAAAVLLLLLLLGCVLVCKGKAHRSEKTHPQAPIYEEMVGVQRPGRKPASRLLEEPESSEYRNCPPKKPPCPENHYESPSGGGLK